MLKDISSSHEGREPRSDSPTKDGARSHGKVRDFATHPVTYRYAKSDFFTLRSGERVLRLRGGADDEGYGGSGWQEDPYKYGDSSNTGWYGDSSNSGGYGDDRWQEDPYRYDPYRPEDLDKYENPFDRWGKEPASTSHISSEEIERLSERLSEMRGESSKEWALDLLHRRITETPDESSKEWALDLLHRRMTETPDESSKEWALDLLHQRITEACDESGRSSQGGNGGGDGGHRGLHDGYDSDEDNNNENIIPLSSETPAVGRLIIDHGRTLSPEEQAFAEFLVQEGHVVIALAEGHTRTSDYLVDGVATELKSVSQITTKDVSGALGRTLLHGAGQAAHVIADTRQQAEVTLEVAERAIRRAYGVDNKYATDNNVPPRLQQIRIIGKDFDITRPRV
jgi:hypothetical protein